MKKEYETIIKNFVKKNLTTRILLSDFITVDIETSDIYIEKYGTELPLPYIWSVCIGDDVLFFRTISEYKEFVAYLKSVLPKKMVKRKRKINGEEKVVEVEQQKQVIIFIHNLFFESVYLKSIFGLPDDAVFKNDRDRKVMYAIDGPIQYRDSYSITNKGLKELTKGLEDHKQSGYDFNYEKVRYPWTVLTPEELSYCSHDVTSLRAAMIRFMGDWKTNLKELPLTITGFTRRRLSDAEKAARETKPEKVDLLALASSGERVKQETFTSTKTPCYAAYKYIQAASRGGNSLPAQKYRSAYYKKETKDILLKDVVSYDGKSWYPGQMRVRKFPIGKFYHLDHIKCDDLARLTEQGQAWVAKMTFHNLRLKNPDEPIPYLASRKCKLFNAKLYLKKRVLSAEQCMCTLTDVDMAIVCKMYNFDSIDTMDCWYSEYGYLPQWLCDVIDDLFKKKESFSKATVDYEINKALFNAIHGCCGTDQLHEKVAFDEEGAAYLTSGGEDEYQKKRIYLALSYAWYVWGTAWGRYGLQELIDFCGDRVVYVDTDAVKILGTIDIDKFNEPWIEKAMARGAYFMKDGKPVIMGAFGVEYVCKEFKCLQTKEYAWVGPVDISKIDEDDFKWAKDHLGWTDEDTKNFNIHLTTSGVNPIRGAMELFKRGGLKEFKRGFEFKEAEKLISTIVEVPYEVVQVDGHDLEICSGVRITSRKGITLGEESTLALDQQTIIKGLEDYLKDELRI